MPEINLLETFDARNWAREFLRINPNCGLDEMTLVGWFANALMKGYDEHRFETREYKMGIARALYPWWNWRHYRPYRRGVTI